MICGGPVLQPPTPGCYLRPPVAAPRVLQDQRLPRCVAVLCSAMAAQAKQHKEAEGTSQEEALSKDLATFVQQIQAELREKRPQMHDQIHDHELPPLISKRRWTHLGELLKAKESKEDFRQRLPEDAWLSLRLDGCRWGTLLGRLKTSGVLQHGFRQEIAETMVATCRAVMCEFGGVVGYTHSDEMTVLIPPGPRIFEGSRCSWISLAASIATATCNRVLGSLAAKKGLVLDATIVAHFDCRVGVYATAAQAESLLLWRASDCNINSASDAIKFSDAPMDVRRFNTIQKLSYLQRRNGLPLQRHQAYGSLLARTEKNADRVVLINGDDSKSRQILNLFRQQSLIPSCYLSNDEIRIAPEELSVPVMSWPCTMPRCH